jgi:hypothetical protein
MLLYEFCCFVLATTSLLSASLCPSKIRFINIYLLLSFVERISVYQTPTALNGKSYDPITPFDTRIGVIFSVVCARVGVTCFANNVTGPSESACCCYCITNTFNLLFYGWGGHNVARVPHCRLLAQFACKNNIYNIFMLFIPCILL